MTPEEWQKIYDQAIKCMDWVMAALCERSLDGLIQYRLWQLLPLDAREWLGSMSETRARKTLFAFKVVV